MAYLFAVFRSRPSPFYLMDEVEAALDDVNLMRFLALVNEFREEAQLIIVSHQKRTMEAADALYGVTMAPGGSSKVVSQKVPRDRNASRPSMPGRRARPTCGRWPRPGSGRPGRRRPTSRDRDAGTEPDGTAPDHDDWHPTQVRPVRTSPDRVDGPERRGCRRHAGCATDVERDSPTARLPDRPVVPPVPPVAAEAEPVGGQDL